MLPALCRSATVPRMEPKIPKSAILTWIFDGAVSFVGSSSILSRRITFYIFMSRWIIRLLWQYSRAVPSCHIISATSRSGIYRLGKRFQYSWSSPPARYSMTTINYYSYALGKASTSLTMCLCLRPLRASTSFFIIWLLNILLEKLRVLTATLSPVNSS